MNHVELHRPNHVWNGHSRDRSRRVRPLRSHYRNRGRNNRKFSGRRRNIRSDPDLRRKRKRNMAHRRNRPRSHKVSQAEVAKARGRSRKNGDLTK